MILFSTQLAGRDNESNYPSYRLPTLAFTLSLGIAPRYFHALQPGRALRRIPVTSSSKTDVLIADVFDESYPNGGAVNQMTVEQAAGVSSASLVFDGGEPSLRAHE